MDLNYLHKKILNDEARLNGFANWDSMKICIKEQEALFIERIVLNTIKKIISENTGQLKLW